MRKEDLLHQKIEQTLIDIDFVSKYQELSDNFRNTQTDYQYTTDQILSIGKENDLSLKAFKGEQYFTDYERCGETEFRFGLTIKHNIIEFDVSIENKAHNISSGGSYGLLVQLLTDWTKTIRKPGFNTYKEMKELIKEGIMLYKDIKFAVYEKFSQEV